MILKKIAFILFIFFFLVFPFSHIKANEPIKILLVPGHDNEVWGAQYGNVKEADMNLILTTRILNLLKKDKRFLVWITRDSLGYTTEFEKYFSVNRESIISFEKDSKEKMQSRIDSGNFIKKIDVQHNKASEDTAIRLFGINKWANENKMDLVLHIHFNDYPRENPWEIGKYKGFTIYTPDDQRSNSKESLKLAKGIFYQLSKKYIPSTYEKELGGLVSDQSLIALGSNDTLSENVRSVLVEYGYIYQKIFRKTITRHQAYKTMADLTVKSMKNYFFP